MKLLYITNGINGSGGLERVLSIKASALAEDYHYEVTILCLNNAHLNLFYDFSSKIKFCSIDVLGNPVQYFLNYKKGIQKAVNQINPDIISVCDDGLKGFFLPTIINTKAKWIYERHASIKFNSKNFVGKISSFVMRNFSSKFDKFVVLTPSNIKEWKGGNLLAIPNPLSFVSEDLSNLENKIVIAVGSHSYNKGYDTLLNVWQKIELKFPDWELNIYGKKDIQQTYPTLAKDLGLKNVRFHSPVQNIQEKYVESSIMVLPSRSEGFGMVLIEAMSCGVPVISFDCPSGPKDIIKNAEDGFLIENQNIKAFTDKLLILIEDVDLRKKMGTCAGKNVQRFNKDEVVNQWDVLFKSFYK